MSSPIVIDTDAIDEITANPADNQIFMQFCEFVGIDHNEVLMTEWSTLSDLFLHIPMPQNQRELARDYPEGYFTAKDQWDVWMTERLNQEYGFELTSSIYQPIVSLFYLIQRKYHANNPTIH